MDAGIEALRSMDAKIVRKKRLFKMPKVMMHSKHFMRSKRAWNNWLKGEKKSVICSSFSHPTFQCRIATVSCACDFLKFRKLVSSITASMIRSCFLMKLFAKNTFFRAFAFAKIFMFRKCENERKHNGNIVEKIQ